MIDGKQCRAARGWLGLEAQELAQLAGIDRATLLRFENGASTMLRTSLDKVRAALEERGVTFTRANQPLGIEDASLTADESDDEDEEGQSGRWRERLVS